MIFYVFPLSLVKIKKEYLEHPFVLGHFEAFLVDSITFAHYAAILQLGKGSTNILKVIFLTELGRGQMNSYKGFC